MNRLFRIATRTLSWGLVATLTLVVVVIAKGVHPEVLVAFKPLTSEPATEAERLSQPPEQFAQVEPNTRLDSPTGARTAKRSSRNRLNARQAPVRNLEAPPEQVAALPQLPPLPATAGEAGGSEIQPETEILKRPAESSLAAPNTVRTKEKESEYLERLASLQQQLNQLAVSQEQNRLVQQSWLESHQNLQQTKLQTQLNGIEASLLALQSKSEQASLLSANPAVSNPNSDVKDQPSAVKSTPTSGPGTGSITRDEPLGPDGRQRLVIHSKPGDFRELLESLDKKPNLNLMLSISVDGNLEMNLKELSAKDLLETPHQPSAHVAEKPSPKAQVKRTSPPRQRDMFLPPVVKNPDTPARIR